MAIIGVSLQLTAMECPAEPMKIEEGPEWRRISPHVQDVVLLGLLEGRYYDDASRMMNSRIKLSPLAITELKKADVEQKILNASLRGGFPNTVNILMALSPNLITKEWAQKEFINAFDHINNEIAQRVLLTLLRSKAAKLIDLNETLYIVTPRRPRKVGLTTKALIGAVMNEAPEIAKALLNAGANPNFQTISGRTALHLAAALGNNDLVRILLNNEASPLIKDNNGMTPLDLALKQNNSDTSQTLARAMGLELPTKRSWLSTWFSSGPYDVEDPNFLNTFKAQIE